ncbi:MAG: hypothetical protein A2X58_09335 [Nitrospirae bacterium GWC2_56_14]|nr:MAG: hypothetical protein A2X58_09335 [Nitrospirae bacterium GWC2_56_14]
MKTIDLLTPMLDNGIRNINFFNGRLLSAEDLSAEQAANRQRQELLGNTIGEGIAYGLEVSLSDKMSSEKKAPLLKIKGGLAVNRNGHAMYLNEDITLALIPEEEKKTLATDAGLFTACIPRTTVGYKTGSGIFVLLMAPATGFDGSAPMSGLGNTTGAARGCGRRYAIEGVQFRLAEMNLNNEAGAAWISDDTRADVLTLMDKPDTASLSKLRNMLAHLCFGTGQLKGFAADPFARSTEGNSALLTYGAVDAMRKQKADTDSVLPAAYYKNNITDCDVPLALICWTKDGVRFVDMWSVRRRVTARNKSLTWPLVADDRKRAEGEAMFLQFQEQLDGINSSELELMKTRDYFRYLPPAGILPLAAKKGSRGIKLANFASGLTLRDKEILEALTFPDRIFIEGAKLRPLLRKAIQYPAIDLKSNELIWTYLIRENIQEIDKSAPRPPQPCLVFTNGQIPFAGDARFDLSYWDYSNYA